MLLIAVVKYSYTSKEEDEDLVNLDEQYNTIQKINPTLKILKKI